ncbi:hypothetical protein BJY01DRAFT_179455 [Aspergillus pseudoustus]|uniref:Fungal STAND N-terminal Goodbye domain-containing protein n=1 Tax=Aspergillus pseudoustus TaxID=1810923 RepID=A0ABR4KWQ0_9EURO
MPNTAILDITVAARTYVTQEGPKYHKAFGEQSKYDDQRHEFVAHGPSSDLEEALRNYHSSGGINWDIQNCTWDDVFDELEAAEGEDARAALGVRPSHVARKGFRWAGDKAAAISPWIDLIPTSNGLSVLGAGLKLLFSIAKEHSNVRQKILAAFGDIPAIITNTTLTRELFKSDKALRDCAIRLYETALRSIQDLVGKLNGNRDRKSSVTKVFHQAKNVLQSPLRVEQIDAIVGSMREQVHQFETIVQRNRDQRDMRIERNAESTLQQVQATRKVGIDIKVGVSEIDEKVDGLARDNKQFQTNHEQVYAEMGRLRAALAAQNGLLAQLTYRSQTPTIVIQQSAIAQDPHSFLPGYQLLEALNVDHMTPVRDVECVLRHCGGVSQADQGQAQQLLQSTQFSAWFWPLASDILFVNGNFDHSSRTSPLSYLCAQLALTLSEDPGCIVLQFFCGQHESETDPLRGPQGLLRSITSQLLYSGYAFSRAFINTRTYSEAIRAHSVEDLCITFRRLVSQLPLNQKVLCVVENISRFEREEWYHDLGFVVEMLYRITQDDSFKPSLKVLFTGATARSRTELVLPPAKSLLLARGSPYGHRPISGRTMLSDVGRQKPSYQEKMAMMGADDDFEEDYF